MILKNQGDVLVTNCLMCVYWTLSSGGVQCLPGRCEHKLLWAVEMQEPVWTDTAQCSPGRWVLLPATGGLHSKWSEAKRQEQLPTLTCISGSRHASGRAAAVTPSRSAGLRLALRHTHSAAGTCSSFHPKITAGNPTDPMRQMQKPPKSRELRELMVLSHLMRP